MANAQRHGAARWRKPNARALWFVVMRKARRPGLASLLQLLKIKPSTLTEDDVGFMVAPRINAASRMDSPDVAARMLATNE
jgi:single-stranded-DNA-specific exonuclease